MLPPLAFFASAPLTVGSTRGRRRDRLAGHVVDDLHIHVRDAAEHGQPRPLHRAAHPLADPVLDPLAAISSYRVFDPHRLLRPGLADLLLQHFAGVAHALLLVGIRLAHAADVRRDLADQLPIHAGHGDVRLLVDGDVDPGRDVEDHRVRIAKREMHLLALQLRAVADADDVELLLEAVGDAGTALATRLRARPWNLPQLAHPRAPASPRALPSVLREHDARRHVCRSLPFGPCTSTASGGDLHGHALRDRDRFLTNSRHANCYAALPDVAEHFAADARLLGGAAGHHAARRRQDAGAETAEHRRHVFDAEIDAAAGTADALEPGDHLLAVRPVLQEQRGSPGAAGGRLLGRLLDHAGSPGCSPRPGGSAQSPPSACSRACRRACAWPTPHCGCA